jgi:hypothetical protein
LRVLMADVAGRAALGAALEALGRYVLRPPIALDRLKLLGPDLVAIELERPWPGRRHPRLDERPHLPHPPGRPRAEAQGARVEIDRSGADVSPRSRSISTRATSGAQRRGVNTTLYYGVLASHAKHRRAVLPEPPDRPRAHDASWAALMRHSFGLDVLRCRICRGRMRLSHVVFDPTEVRRLLVHLRCFSDPLPIAPSRGPPDAHDTLDVP